MIKQSKVPEDKNTISRDINLHVGYVMSKYTGGTPSYSGTNTQNHTQTCPKHETDSSLEYGECIWPTRRVISHKIRPMLANDRRRASITGHTATVTSWLVGCSEWGFESHLRDPWEHNVK